MEKTYTHGIATETAMFKDLYNGKVEFTSFAGDHKKVLVDLYDKSGRKVWFGYLGILQAAHLIRLCANRVGGVCYVFETLMD